MNDIIKLHIPIAKGTTEQIVHNVRALEKCVPCYSFVVRTVFDDDILTGWSVQINISAIERYNTITPESLVRQVVGIISNNLSNIHEVIGYGQGPVDIMIEAAEPLTKDLAKKAYHAWGAWAEYEDYAQMCRLVILELYQKGYYIMQSIIKRTFWNQVYKFVGKDRHHKEILSLDTETVDGEPTYDVIPDRNLEFMITDKEQTEDEIEMLTKLKAIIIDYIGQRQYDQLLLEYTNKMTTPWARKKVQSIKLYLQGRPSLWNG